MRLTPKEMDRLTIFTVAEMARRRRGRGLRLNLPEAVGLICDEMMEAARDGRSYDEVVALGMSLLSPDEVQDGVPALLDVVQVEPQFADGSKLVTLRYPIGPPPESGVGEVRFAEGEIALAEGRQRARLTIRNPTQYPIQLTSHLPLSEANPALIFDRAAVAGMRLDLPAGGAVRLESGEERTVGIVCFGGGRRDAE